ncbi:MAG: adenylate/guanylate cyclase domain-containing protein [Actinomycetota bacterium]
MISPETQYTKVGDAFIGYQIIGDGPIDLIYVPGFASNIETLWDWPAYAKVFERLAFYSRLILFDPRGSGVSDPMPMTSVRTWEQVTEDVRAVLEAAKSERTAIFAQVDGGLPAILFAATYPDRISSLVLWNCYARAMTDDEYPIGVEPTDVDDVWDMLSELWGRPSMAIVSDPTMADDAEYVKAFARFTRTAASPTRAIAAMRYSQHIDARPALPSVRVPTLVVHTHNAFIPLEHGRYLADHIPGARFLEVATPDLNLILGDSGETVLDEVEEFLTGSRKPVAVDRVLATVVFTDIVGSTAKASALGDRKWKELLAQHDRIAREEVERFNGRLVTKTGDGILATFDGPGRAIRCAHALSRALERADLPIRAGIHTGEIELREDDDIGGIAVHITSRIMSEAGPGEVVCSRTVKDLVAGSEFTFDNRGLCSLRGVPEEWQLYAVRSS